MKTTRLAALLALTFVAPATVLADPPPWAPAHGWRKKNDPYYTGYTGRRWNDDYGVASGRCMREAVGAAVGGVVGGALGAQIGKGNGRTVATIVGAALGAYFGAEIGRQMDGADYGCIGHALELAGERQTITWAGAGGGQYALTPTRGYQRNGMPCRDFRLVFSDRGGRSGGDYRACQQQPGSWQIY